MVTDLLKSDLTFYSEYSVKYSQRKYYKKQIQKQGKLKIVENHKLVSYIENSIKTEKNSPYVALENAKKANIEVTICEKTLYNYINPGLFLNINKSHLPYNKKIN